MHVRDLLEACQLEHEYFWPTLSKFTWTCRLSPWPSNRRIVPSPNFGCRTRVPRRIGSSSPGNCIARERRRAGSARQGRGERDAVRGVERPAHGDARAHVLDASEGSFRQEARASR
jgi:hypothetical protein